MSQKEQISESAEQAVVITRVFDAPRSIVWKAWTDPELFMKWWGPKGFTAPFAKMDVCVEGRYLNAMRSPDGKEFWGTGVYTEVIPMSRLVMTDNFSDNEGNIVPPSYYGMSGDTAVQMKVTLTFEEVNGKTKMTLRHADVRNMSTKDRKDMEQGWNESLDKLDQLLAKNKMVMSAPT